MPSYNYYSLALGKRIHTKKDYDKAMKEGGFVPYKEGKQMAEARQKELYKPYDKPSDKALGLMRELKISGKRDGSIKLSDRQVDAMKKMGMRFNPSFMPKDMKGGYETS